jgi:hypothetical protein
MFVTYYIIVLQNSLCIVRLRKRKSRENPLMEASLPGRVSEQSREINSSQSNVGVMQVVKGDIQHPTSLPNPENNI